MAAASPIPALADRFAALREDAVALVDALQDDDTPSGRSMRVSLREFLRQTSGPNDRLQTMAAAAKVAAPAEPLVREALPNSLRDPRMHRGYHP